MMPKITKRLVDSLPPDRNGRDVFRWDAVTARSKALACE